MSSVPYLGHLPQDLLGTSALEFYHPNDLPELKKIYDSGMEMRMREREPNQVLIELL